MDIIISADQNILTLITKVNTETIIQLNPQQLETLLQTDKTEDLIYDRKI